MNDKNFELSCELADKIYFGMDINKYIQKRIRENMGLKPEEVDNDHCEQLIKPQANERNK